MDEDDKNIILYGALGTGKIYNVINKALEIIDKEGFIELKNNRDREKLVNRYKTLVETGQITFCTFHQSYGDEEFVEGLKSDGRGNFVNGDGILKRLAFNAAYELWEKDNELVYPEYSNIGYRKYEIYVNDELENIIEKINKEKQKNILFGEKVYDYTTVDERNKIK